MSNVTLGAMPPSPKELRHGIRRLRPRRPGTHSPPDAGVPRPGQRPDRADELNAGVCRARLPRRLLREQHAIEGLTDALRLELRGTNIHVAIVEPGPIKAKFRDNAYAAFKAYVDSAHSAHREQYETMIARLEGQRGPLPFTLPPEAVLKRVVHALESKHPHRRYQVDGAGVSDGVAATTAADAMARLAAPSHRRRWTPLTPARIGATKSPSRPYASAALKRLLFLPLLDWVLDWVGGRGKR